VTGAAFVPPIGAKVTIDARCATHHRLTGHARFTWTGARRTFQLTGCGRSGCHLEATVTYTYADPTA
jgi:hypothetical protein